jgi:hypothetical protein
MTDYNIDIEDLIEKMKVYKTKIDSLFNYYYQATKEANQRHEELMRLSSYKDSDWEKWKENCEQHTASAEAAIACANLKLCFEHFFPEISQESNDNKDKL